LKKLMLLIAMLTVGLVVAAPAMAQVGQGFSEARDKSGTATPKVEVKNTGNNANLCAQLQQAVQTGQVLNEQGVTQYVSNADDIDLTGSEIGLTPSETAECTQQIQQSSAAGPKAEAKAGKAEAKAGAPEAKAGGAAAKALPATGGLDSLPLLGLGGAALLLGGGLLARKMSR
jgi:hypothetical protein